MMRKRPRGTRNSTSKFLEIAPCTKTAGSRVGGWTEFRGKLILKHSRDSHQANGTPTTTSANCTISTRTSRRLTALFWSEAEKYQVLPLLGEMATVWGFPKGLPDQTKFTYYNGTENISSGMIPPIYNRSYTITADLVNPGRPGLGL